MLSPAEPRGSVYHHFPAGRSQMLREALDFAGDDITAQIDQAADVSASVLLREFVEMWRENLIGSDYSAGRPVLAAAVGSGQDENQLATAAGEIFRRWRDASTRASFERVSTPPKPRHWRTQPLPRWRAPWCCAGPPRSIEPLDDVARQMEFLIEARKFVGKFNAGVHVAEPGRRAIDVGPGPRDTTQRTYAVRHHHP